MVMSSTNLMNSPSNDVDLDDTTDKSTVVFVHEDSSRGSPFNNKRDGQSDTNDDWDHVTEIRDYDCLLGRGGGANKNMGNVKFRELIKQYKFKYLAASKVKKPKVAEEVVQIWRNMKPAGRFLARKNEDDKKEGGNSDKKKKKGKSDDEDSDPEEAWYDVGDKRARAKASMALRERTPDAISYVQTLREQEDVQAKQGAFLVQQKNQMHQDAAQAIAAGLRHPLEQQYLAQAQQQVTAISCNNSHNFQLMNQQQQHHPAATPFLTRQGSDVALCAGLSDMHMTQDPVQHQNQQLLGTSGAANDMATKSLLAQQHDIQVRTMEEQLIRKQDELESLQQRLLTQPHPRQDILQRQQELLRRQLPSQPQSPPHQQRSMHVSPASVPVHSPSSSSSPVTSSSDSPIASSPIEDSNKPLALSPIISKNKKPALTQDDRNMELYRSLLENYFDREIREEVDSDLEDEWDNRNGNQTGSANTGGAGGGGTPPQGESLDNSSSVIAPLPPSLLPPHHHHSRRPPRRSGSSSGSLHSNGGLLHPGGPQRRGVGRKESNMSMHSTGSGMGSVRSDDGSAVTDLMAMSIISGELDCMSMHDHDDDGQSIHSL